MGTDERLEALVSCELEHLGFELVKLETSLRGRKQIIRIFIDNPDECVTLDHCIQVTRAVGFALDGEEAVQGPYNLEVSSPGMNRPLATPDHFRRFRGREVKIVHEPGNGERKKSFGTIVNMSDGAVALSVNGEEHSIPFDSIISANLHGEKWDIRGGKNRV